MAIRVPDSSPAARQPNAQDQIDAQKNDVHDKHEPRGPHHKPDQKHGAGKAGEGHGSGAKGISALQTNDALGGGENGVAESAAALSAAMVVEPGAPGGGDTSWAGEFESLFSQVPNVDLKSAGDAFAIDDLGGHGLPSMLIGTPSLLVAASGAAAQAVDEGESLLSGKDGAGNGMRERIAVFKSYDRLVSRFFAQGSPGEGASFTSATLAPSQQQMLAVSAHMADIYRSYLKLPAKPAPRGLADHGDDPSYGAGELVPEIPSPLLIKMEGAVSQMVSEGAARMSGGISGVALGRAQGALDIDALLIVVMMNSTKVEEDLLADKLKEMQARNNQKKQLRDIKTRMKQEESRLESQMLTEFNEAKANGEIAASVKFEDYKAWRQCQYANVRENLDGDGNRTLSWPPAQLEEPRPEIPEWMHTGEVKPAGKTDPTSGPADATQDLCTQYGFSATTRAVLLKLCNNLPTDQKALYPKFEDWLQQMGMAPAHSIEDIRNNLQAVQQIIANQKDADRQTAIAANEAKMKKYYEETLPAYQQKKKEYDDEIAKNKADLDELKKNALPMELLTNPGSQLNADLLNYVYGDAMTRLGLDPGSEFRDVKNRLEELFKKNMTPEFKDKLSSVMKSLYGYIGGAVNVIHDSLSKFYNQGPQKDPHSTALFNPVLRKVSGEDLSNWQNRELYFGKNWDHYEWQHGQYKSSPLDRGDLNNLCWDANGLHGQFRLEDKEGDSETWANDWNPEVDNPIVKEFQLRMAKSGGRVGWTQIDKAYNDYDALAKGDGLQGLPALHVVDFDKVDPKATKPPPTEPAKDFVEPSSSITVGPNGDKFDVLWDSIDRALGDLDNAGSGYRRWIASKHLDGSEPPPDPKKPDPKTKPPKSPPSTTGLPSDGLGGFLENKGTIAEMDAYAQQIDDRLSTLSEASEIDMLQMQSMMQRRSQFIEALSNMIKKIGQSADNILGNIKS